nr:hypothetical protein [Tanacetum cinerariifolium]
MVKNLDNVNKLLMYPRNMKRVGKGFSGRDTPLFPAMMTSVPISVADEAVNEEMDDSLERAVTTATSLDAEQDRGVNTPRSGEDILKLTKLMELCTKLQQRVLDLETTKTTQAMEIESLKKRVKKLEKRKRSRTHGHKRLYKVGLSEIVESSEDEGLGGKEVFFAQQDDKVIENEVDAAQVQVTTTATTTPTISIDEATLAQALAELTIPKPRSHDKGKAKTIKELVKLKKKDQIQLDEELALKLQAGLQAEFDKEQRLTTERAQ